MPGFGRLLIAREGEGGVGRVYAGSSRPAGARRCRRQNSQPTMAKSIAFHRTPFRNAMR